MLLHGQQVHKQNDEMGLRYRNDYVEAIASFFDNPMSWASVPQIHDRPRKDAGRVRAAGPGSDR